MNAASLCAGIGGLDIATETIWPDTRLVWTSEMDAHCRTILNRHWPDTEHHGRFDRHGITNGPAWQELPHVDILTAGFPCQDISYAGLGAGINGPRSSVFFHVANAVHEERAPDPLDRGRLNPDLPRWMMGYPPGWTDGIPKTARLRAAGNAVCPQQGAEGIRRCLELIGAC